MSIEVVLPVRRPFDIYCVYEHVIAGPEVIFVGVDRITNVFNMNQVSNNSEWRRIFNAGGEVLIRVLLHGPDQSVMKREAARYMKQLPQLPRCNLRGVRTHGMTRAVWCSNGTVYPSQTAASVELGIPQSLISRCVRGLSKSIHGYQFREARPDDGPIREVMR